ncbi:MAG: bifunctional DNA-formamidopyrimidine glycosylase/DNA-(apurinic or apyrimidinic site) lyase [Tepidisphaeraceae bacterium]
MPELPEVQTVVMTLQPRITGRIVERVDLARRDILRPCELDLAAHVVGRAITSVERRGKRIVFTLSDDARFYVHLGMSGRLTVEPTDAPARPHTHLRLDLSGGAGEIRFVDPRRFGGVWWLGRDHAPDDALGPEPLRLRAGHLSKRLARTGRAIKNVLLDQTVVAGLGNIYVDESLFAAGIHPLRRADGLDPEEVRRLNRSIKTVLRRAIRHRGSTLRDYRDADGNAGGFQLLHRVYGRAGEPCRACESPIERIVLGGRSTHFCPRCQALRRAKST